MYNDANTPSILLQSNKNTCLTLFFCSRFTICHFELLLFKLAMRLVWGSTWIIITELQKFPWITVDGLMTNRIFLTGILSLSPVHQNYKHQVCFYCFHSCSLVLRHDLFSFEISNAVSSQVSLKFRWFLRLRRQLSKAPRKKSVFFRG